MQPVENNKRDIMVTFAVLVALVIIVSGAMIITKKDANTSEVASKSEKTSADTTPTATTPSPTTSETTTPTTETTTPTPTTASSGYKDGSYSATGSYISPGGSQRIAISVTLKDGVVTDTSAQEKSSDRESEEYQSQFISGYKKSVVGKSIDSINLHRVSGSSLTSEGFNDALDQIKSQAKA